MLSTMTSEHPYRPMPIDTRERMREIELAVAQMRLMNANGRSREELAQRLVTAG